MTVVEDAQVRAVLDLLEVLRVQEIERGASATEFARHLVSTLDLRFEVAGVLNRVVCIGSSRNQLQVLLAATLSSSSSDGSASALFLLASSSSSSSLGGGGTVDSSLRKSDSLSLSTSSTLATTLRRSAAGVSAHAAAEEAPARWSGDTRSGGCIGPRFPSASG